MGWLLGLLWSPLASTRPGHLFAPGASVPALLSPSFQLTLRFFQTEGCLLRGLTTLTFLGVSQGSPSSLPPWPASLFPHAAGQQGGGEGKSRRVWVRKAGRQDRGFSQYHRKASSGPRLT